MASTKTAPKSRTKSEVFAEIADKTGLARKEISAVFEALATCISKDIGKRGSGIFTVPGLMKIKRIHKPATKAREGVNPFTGERMMFKPKPARNVVKVQALKNLKSMV